MTGDRSVDSVSVVIPARQAGGVLDACLTAVVAQADDLPDHLPYSVAVAVGPSTDDTAGLARRWAACDDRIRVVDNPVGRTAAGLNAAIAATDGELVVRVDAQAVVPSGYVARLVELAEETGAANVGGLQWPVGEGVWPEAIAIAMRSAFGAGPAAFRGRDEPGPADTVYLGAFRRAALERIGGFDEQLVRNQDYELNHRLRRAGETIWLDPALKVAYRPRSSLRALAVQYLQYGAWKRVMLLRHPGSLRVRQLAAPVLVLALLASIVAGVFVSPIAVLVPLVYLIALAVAARRCVGASRLRIAAAMATMHLAWGSGFLLGPRVVSRGS